MTENLGIGQNEVFGKGCLYQGVRVRKESKLMKLHFEHLIKDMGRQSSEVRQRFWNHSYRSGN